MNYKDKLLVLCGCLEEMKVNGYDDLAIVYTFELRDDLKLMFRQEYKELLSNKSKDKSFNFIIGEDFDLRISMPNDFKDINKVINDIKSFYPNCKSDNNNFLTMYIR